MSGPAASAGVLDINGLRLSAMRYLSAAGGLTAQGIKETVSSLHRIPPERFSLVEHRVDVYSLIRCYFEYKEGGATDLFTSRIDSRGLSLPSLESFEAVFKAAAALGEQAPALISAHQVIPRAIQPIQENLAKINFYCGVFALVRGDFDAADTHFTKAGSLSVWNVNAGEMTGAILEDRHTKVLDRQGGRFTYIAGFFPKVEGDHKEAAQDPARVEAQVQLIVREAEKLVMQRESDPMGALKHVRSALTLHPAHPKAEESRRQILQLVYQWINHGKNAQEKISRADQLLADEPNEFRAQVIVVGLWAEMSSSMVADRILGRINLSRPRLQALLESQPERMEELTRFKDQFDYYEAYALSLKGDNRRALTIVSGFSAKHPFYRQSIPGIDCR